jgi:hypothetical protein
LLPQPHLSLFTGPTQKAKAYLCSVSQKQRLWQGFPSLEERSIHMNTFTQLIREGKVGSWCKRGAFFITALGILHVLAILYVGWLQYQQTNRAPSSFAFLLFGASQIFWVISYTVFFSLILYTVGAVVNSFSLPAKSDVAYESLDKEENRSVDEQAVHTGN